MATDTDARLRSAASAYDALAPYYDAFTQHPNYPVWVRSLESLARRHGLTGRRALDLACGTGSSLEPLIELGYDVVGCDISGGMLEQAASKLASRVPLVAADIQDVPELGCFDLVWCLNDGMNYLVDDDQLRRACASAARCLSRGGIFLFDVNTLSTYATFFATTQVRETDALFMVWIGTGQSRPQPGQTIDTRLEVFTRSSDGDDWQRTTSRHRQRHHPLREVDAALAAAGLRTLAVCGLTEDAVIDDPLDEGRHRKAIFVTTHDGTERR